MARTLRVLFYEIPILGGLLLGAAGFGLGYLARYAFIEPDVLGIICGESVQPPLWCAPRKLLILSTGTPLPLPPDFLGSLAPLGRHIPSVVSMVVLASAVLAWLLSGRRALRMALLTLALSGLGLILYNASAAVLALTVAAVRLIRMERDPGAAASGERHTEKPLFGR